MVVNIQTLNDRPRCEGWLDKFSVGRGLFSNKSWKRRYVIVTREGIGYAHRASECQKSPSETRCFVPFEEPTGVDKEVRLRPVYLLRRVTPCMHPEVPVRDSQPLPAALVPAESDDCQFFFALSFTERGKRFFLLLRAQNAEEHHVWTSVLSLYVHEGSLNTVVPVPHPLEAQNGWLGTIWSSSKGFYPKMGRGMTRNLFSSMYVKDPDPCPSSALVRIRRRVLWWNEGESKRHLNLYKESPHDVYEELLLIQKRNEEERTRLASAAKEVGSRCSEVVADSFFVKDNDLDLSLNWF